MQQVRQLLERLYAEGSSRQIHPEAARASVDQFGNGRAYQFLVRECELNHRGPDILRQLKPHIRRLGVACNWHDFTIGRHEGARYVRPPIPSPQVRRTWSESGKEMAAARM